MRYAEPALGALAVFGLLMVAYGLTQPMFTSGVSVEGPVGEAAVDDGEVVAYDALDAAEREIFDRARTGDGSAEHAVGEWSTRSEFVRADGGYYEVSTWGGENGTRTLSIAAGWGLVGVGLVGLGLVQLVRRLTGGELRLFSS